MEKYWEAIRERVFSRCIDERDGAGTVCPTDEAQCLIKRFLPELINIVNSIKRDRMDAYIDALRTTICVKCEYSRPDGSCDLRKRVDCCLDRYYPLIVEAIEMVSSKHPNHQENA